MPSFLRSVLLGAVAAVAALFVAASPATAQPASPAAALASPGVPSPRTALPASARAGAADSLAREIPYQGVLTDGGVPVTDPTAVGFQLWDAPTGGAGVWTETQIVTPDADGRFAVRLGTVKPLPVELARPLWLAVLAGGAALGPRTALGAAPYALALYGFAATPSTVGFDDYAPNLVGGAPENDLGPSVGGATISGGGYSALPNAVTESYGTVGGGLGNTVSGFNATIGGGQRNAASGDYGTVAGGRQNEASRASATVGGGTGNTASAQHAVVAGGTGNQATLDFAAVGGGVGNTATGLTSTVGGGQSNAATGEGATVPGGRFNRASRLTAFAAGTRAQADHDFTFVWSGASGGLTSTGSGQFLVGAPGGVGLGEAAPLADLHVDGGGLTLAATALSGEDVVVEASDAIVGLYSNDVGSWGSGLALGELDATGGLSTKWSVVRRTGAAGSLHFAFGTSPDYFGNDTQMRIDVDGSVHADGSFIGGGADLAEYFPLDAGATVAPGQVVGLRGGRVSLATDGAEQVAVISSDPAFVGNPDAAAGGALVALVGQVRVGIVGAAAPGDVLVASGAADGRARAVSPEAYVPEDGAVLGRVLTAGDGDGVALVGVDEAAALRAVVQRQGSRLDAQQDELDALRAELEALRAVVAPASTGPRRTVASRALIPYRPD